MGFQYINFQDQQENAYCGGFVLAAMINQFKSLPPNKPYGTDIYHEVQHIQKTTITGQRKCFIDKMSLYLHDHNIEGTYSLPSSIAIYAQQMGLNPTIHYNELKLRNVFSSISKDIKLKELNVDVFIEEEISLANSFQIPVFGNAKNFFIANSIALVETGMHWIAIGNTEEKEDKKIYYDPWSTNKPIYEYSGINIALNKA